MRKSIRILEVNEVDLNMIYDRTLCYNLKHNGLIAFKTVRFITRIIKFMYYKYI